MEKAAGKTKTKYLKTAVCLILCLTVLTLTLFMGYQEAQAFAPALVLAGYAIPEAVQIVGAILVAAGLTWAVDSVGQRTSEWFYSSCTPAIKQGIADIIGTAKEGIANVSTEVWNYTRDWVRANYAVGENNKAVNYYEYPLASSKVPFTVDTPSNTSIYPIPSVTIDGHTYSISEETQGAYKTLKLSIDGYTKDSSGSLFAMAITADAINPYCMYLDTNSDGTGGLCIAVQYYNKISSVYEDVKYWYTIPGTSATTDALVKSPTEALPITGQPIVADKNWDIATPEGKRAVAYPATTAGLVGKTAADVANPKPAAAELTGPWWDTLLKSIIGPITTAVDNIWKWLQDFWEKLMEKLQQAIRPVIDTLTDVLTNIKAKAQSIIDAITGVREAVQESDVNEPLKRYKLPDLFILILKVILACIRLILRSLIMIATLPAIPADAGNINADFLQGVNFLKNQKIPFFDISMWSMASGVAATFFGLAVVRRIRRLYAV